MPGHLQPVAASTATMIANNAQADAPQKLLETVQIRAWLLGERLDTRALEGNEALGKAPLVLRLSDGGIAVLFRYGAAVLFNTSQAVEADFLRHLAPMLTEPFASRESEVARLRIDPMAEEQVEVLGGDRDP